MNARNDDDAVEARKAHRLYWYSDLSVNQIAEELSLSKGRLYGLIEPLPSGLACPRCSAEMMYANRTAREQELLNCPNCGHEEVEPSVGEDIREAAPPRGPAQPARSREALRSLDLEEFPTRVVLGGALLGVAAGAILVSFLRKR